MRRVVLTLALAAASCAGPRIERPAALVGAAWPARAERAPAAAPSAREDGPWTLARIQERIAAANPTLAVAEARLEEARAAASAVRASLWPTLSLALGYVATDEPAQAFGLLLDQHALDLGPSFDPTPGTIENWRKEARLDWALLEPGRGSRRQAAKEGERAAELGGQALERRLLNAGLQAWLGLRAARALAEVAEESVGVVEQRLQVTRVRHEQGAALRADVLRLEVRLSTARQSVAQAALARHEAESALNRLLGRAPAAPLVLAAEEPVIGAELPAELEALQALAREQRLDLAAAAHAVRRLAFQREAARALRLPELRAFAAYAMDGSEPALDSELDSTTVGLALRLPLSLRTGAEIHQAEAEERRARAELAELAQVAAQEVGDALERWGAARTTEDLATSSVGAAEEAYRILAAAQDAGAATVTDVLEAQDERNRARVGLVVARAGVALARARLVAATGGVR